MECIYCGPGKTASKEHIVPRAIGGSYARSDIICEECNSYFGREVDLHITNWQLSLIARSWFDLEGYEGSIPSYEVEASDGTRLTVGRKGDLRPKWRDVVTKRNGKSFYFSGGAPTEAEARKAIERVIAKQTALAGRPPNIAESHVEVHVRREWKPLESDVVYSFDKQGRVIAKMALHYLATQLDRRFLRTRDFEPIMRFVRHGTHAKHPRLCQPAIPMEDSETAKPCIEHSLNLRCSHELGSAICDVTLFGVLRYSVVLSYSYEGPNLFRSLHEYPLERRCEEVPAPELAPVPARLILNIDEDERQSRYDRLEETVHGLVDWLNEYGFRYYIRHTLPAVMERVSGQVPLPAGDPSGWLAAVACYFSLRSSPYTLVHHFLGEPSRLAAQILHDRLQLTGAAGQLSIGDVEERFARLIFIRLLVDALQFLIQEREAAQESHMQSGDTACHSVFRNGLTDEQQ